MFSGFYLLFISLLLSLSHCDCLHLTLPPRNLTLFHVFSSYILMTVQSCLKNANYVVDTYGVNLLVCTFKSLPCRISLVFCIYYFCWFLIVLWLECFGKYTNAALLLPILWNCFWFQQHTQLVSLYNSLHWATVHKGIAPRSDENEQKSFTGQNYFVHR